MFRRQTMPREWLIVRGPHDSEGLAAAMRLPKGTGVLALEPLASSEVRRLRLLGLVVVTEEAGTAARVHDLHDLRQALLARTPLIFLSPIHATRSHPDWQPIPQMRAAAIARLGRRSLFALGGMDARKFARVERLGFQGWAGISAFRT